MAAPAVDAVPTLLYLAPLASPRAIDFSLSDPNVRQALEDAGYRIGRDFESTSKSILIAMLSSFGSALLVVFILLIIYFLRYTNRGRILLDRIGRPGEFDDEQAFLKEEAEALEEMDDMQRAEYMRAKAFTQANPPESAQTDISLSQFMAIQEKGVSAWEFEPELEIANCFVEGRTEIEFFDAECSVQSNLPIPKQNDVYYWEAKIYDKPDTTTIAVGVTTKPYPLFRLPGYHKTSVAYLSPGDRRFNQPFKPLPSYGPPFVRGDVVGCGYRPRSGTIFFTRNGKKLDDVTHTLKTQNLFPTVGATGPCTVHVNFGQMGFVFIEANVKKWGLAPMTGSLAPPPPYGSEQGSTLLEGGQHGVQEGQGWLHAENWSPRHGRSRSAQVRAGRLPPTSPGPHRSPTDISLAQLELIHSSEVEMEDEELAAGGGARSRPEFPGSIPRSHFSSSSVGVISLGQQEVSIPDEVPAVPPPDYRSPGDEDDEYARRERGDGYFDESGEGDSTPGPGTAVRSEAEDIPEERQRLLGRRKRGRTASDSPPIPSYDAAVGNSSGNGEG